MRIISDRRQVVARHGFSPGSVMTRLRIVDSQDTKKGWAGCADSGARWPFLLCFCVHFPIQPHEAGAGVCFLKFDIRMGGIPFHNFNLVSVVNGHIPANYCEVRDLAVQRDAKVDCFFEFWYPRILK